MQQSSYISSFLARNASRIGDQQFLICPGKSLTWLEAYELSKVVTAFISKKLAGKQQKTVAIFLPDTWEFVVTYLGITSSGNIAFPIDMSFKKLEVDSVIDIVKPELIITSRASSAPISQQAYMVEDILSQSEELEPVTYELPPKEQIATLFLSSGTTGSPKAIPNTHENQLWDVAAIARPMGWTADDTLLITLHLSHRHGLVICLLSAIYHGNTVYLEERFNAERTLGLLESGKVSIYSSVPSAYEKLIDFEPSRKFDVGGVRLFASSSSLLPPYLHEAFKERFKKGIVDRYGTSETGSIAIKDQVSESIFGEVLEGVELRTEPGGEIALKSPGIFPGYLNNPEATQKSTTKDGWWLTGDIGEIKNGQLFLKGRSKERINKSGYSVYPQDIEWALLHDKKVAAVKVIGMPIEHSLDDRIFAFYVGDTTSQELVEYSLANLPRSWRPDHYIKLEVLPKNANGKVSLVGLRKLLHDNYSELL